MFLKVFLIEAVIFIYIFIQKLSCILDTLQSTNIIYFGWSQYSLCSIKIDGFELELVQSRANLYETEGVHMSKRITSCAHIITSTDYKTKSNESRRKKYNQS